MFYIAGSGGHKRPKDVQTDWTGSFLDEKANNNQMTSSKKRKNLSLKLKPTRAILPTTRVEPESDISEVASTHSHQVVEEGGGTSAGVQHQAMKLPVQFVYSQTLLKKHISVVSEMTPNSLHTNSHCEKSGFARLLAVGICVQAVAVISSSYFFL